MNIKEKLEQIGLSKNESKIYFTLLSIGSSKAGKISKEAEIDRSSTYNALKSLLKKGLVSYITIGKVKYFQASDPKNIESYLKEKQDILKEILPNLEKKYKATKLEQNVRLFKGRKGVKFVLDDIIKEAKENLIFGSEGQLKKYYPLYAKKFVARLIQKNIKTKSIIRKGRKKKNTPFQKYKYLPTRSESPVTTNIYANKIAIIVWSETPEVILIENKKAADSYRAYFNFMWKNANKS